MKISAIISVHSGERYLGKLLDAIINRKDLK